MNRFLVLLVFVALCFAVEVSIAPSEIEQSSTQHLIMDDDDNVLLVDAGNASENTLIIDFLQSITDEIDVILVTHSHPDHWQGLSALSAAYPNAKLGVSQSQMIDEIEETRAQRFPDDTFDYRGRLVVIDDDDDTMNGLDLTLIDYLLPAESVLYTLVYHEEDNFVVCGDVITPGTHLFFGPGTNLASTRNWYGSVLPKMLPGGSLGFDEDTVFYSGHGVTTDYKTAEFEIEYLQVWENNLLSCPDGVNHISLDDLVNLMIETYPDLYSDGLSLFVGFNEDAWLADQAANPCKIESDDDDDNSPVSLVSSNDDDDDDAVVDDSDDDDDNGIFDDDSSSAGSLAFFSTTLVAAVLAF